MPPAVLLWDFGDTLVDERWMWTPPAGVPTWTDAWQRTMEELATSWDMGAITSHDVYAALGARTGMPLHAVERHARECCLRITFNETAWRVAREHRLPQALVTVNPDLFTEIVLVEHRLDEVFDAIVVSSAVGTADKPALCEIALGHLGFTGDRSQALLIDNRQDAVDAWRAKGGAGYRFEGDSRFQEDLPSLFS